MLPPSAESHNQPLSESTELSTITPYYEFGGSKTVQVVAYSYYVGLPLKRQTRFKKKPQQTRQIVTEALRTEREGFGISVSVNQIQKFCKGQLDLRLKDDR